MTLRTSSIKWPTSWKAILPIFVWLMLSCGSKKPTESNSTASPNSVIRDTSHQSMDTKQAYSIDYNNKNQYLSYGSILGKPMDTIIGSDTVWFYHKGKLVFKEIAETHYAFYKHNTHWPKHIQLSNHTDLFLLERMLGEPIGSDIVGFQFENEKLIKKIVFTDYSWWDIDMSRDYSERELMQIIDKHPL